MKSPAIAVPTDDIRVFCEKHHIRKFALFGSVLRDDFTPESDVDVLVELEPGHRIGLIAFARLEDELTSLLGRPVDLNTFKGLDPLFRETVLANAEILYDAAQ